MANLFASADNAQCPLLLSLRLSDNPPLGVDVLAHGFWPVGLLFAFSLLRLLAPLLHGLSFKISIAADRELPSVPSLTGPQAPDLEVERGRLTRIGLPPPPASVTRRLFAAWCGDRALNPCGCLVKGVLEFIQGLLGSGRAASTLAVFAKALTTGHEGFGRFSACSQPSG